MALRLEDYAFLSDTECAGLVGIDGSIDWLGFPRFDSSTCFAAILGTEDNGRWLLAPAGGVRHVQRHYRGHSLVLETEFETDDGVVAIIDCMPLRNERPHVVRLVEGRQGRVPMRMDLRIRYDYGCIVPWVRRVGGVLTAIAGPDALCLATPVMTSGDNTRTTAEFLVSAGERVSFVLQWYPSHCRPEPIEDPVQAVAATEEWWRRWIEPCNYHGQWADEVRQSLVILKGLTYAPTGGIIAAATTSLPEEIGGERNWDYRFCWLRDATFTLMALLGAGFTDEARAWRDWLLRAVAGEPSKLQIMYGPAGERRLDEHEIPWLPGYLGSSPVRIGNAASCQFQLDVWGEVTDALYQARAKGIHADEDAWHLQRALLDFLEGHWHDPDEGIWEIRGPRRHFTHSRVMAWVAFDRSVKTVERWNLDGPVERWRGLRDEIHREVCKRGVDARGVFVQEYGGHALDASLLTIPLVGFLPASDPRVVATVDAIRHGLCADGFVRRYDPSITNDGLHGQEGAFLMCTFWLADNLALQGRTDEARELFETLLALRNDVGLLSEQYDPGARRLLGNLPQAFSHVAIINTAANLCAGRPSPAEERGQGAQQAAPGA